MAKKYQQYEYGEMEAAIQDVQDGMGIRRSAKIHSVPYNTLRDKVSGRTPKEKKLGANPFLSKEEEKILVVWAITSCKAGFPVTKDDLLNSVQHFVKEQKRETPFVDDRPGRKWYASFLKRNPELAIRTPQNLTASRALLTEAKLVSWYKEVDSYIQDHNLTDILQDPHRIFNADETAFHMNPKGNVVLAERGTKNVYQKVNADEKECITVLVTGNAAGEMAPPLICWKYERFPHEIVFSMPLGWGLGKSSSGWMTGEVFFEYVANIFHKWLIENNVPLPVILFIDGHTSHLTLHTSKFCKENGIVLVALLPNATHVLQPMDVAVFKPLKSEWKKGIHAWRMQQLALKCDTTFKKKDFPKLLKTTLEKCVSPDVLKAGFRKCGLFPWNTSAAQVQDLLLRDSQLAETPSTVAIPASGAPTAETGPTAEPGPTLPESPAASRGSNATPPPEVSPINALPPPPSPPPNVVQEVVHEKRLCAMDIVKDFLGVSKVQEFEAAGEEWHGDRSFEKLFQLWRVITTSLPTTEQQTIIPPTHSDPNISNQSKDKVPVTPPRTFTIIMPPSKRSSSTTPTTVTIPSPFKRACLWPEPKPPKGKRVPKERTPAVVSSDAWVDQCTKKLELKADILRKKEERAVMIAEKKERQKAMQRITVTQEDAESVDSNEDGDEEKSEDEDIVFLEKPDSENIKAGSFVLVSFPGGKRGKTVFKYACIIQELHGDDITVLAMRAIDLKKKTFVPKDGDVSTVTLAQVLGVLPTPNVQQYGMRMRYAFPGSVDVNESR